MNVCRDKVEARLAWSLNISSPNYEMNSSRRSQSVINEFATSRTYIAEEKSANSSVQISNALTWSNDRKTDKEGRKGEAGGASEARNSNDPPTTPPTQPP